MEELDEEMQAARAAYALLGRRLARGQEPPWDWYQLMKAREGLSALIESYDAQKAQDPSQQPTQRPSLTVVE